MEAGKSTLVERLITEVGTDVVKQLSEAIVDKHKVASGRLLNSLSFEVKQLLTEFQIIFYGEKYFINVEDGRKPGTFPPISAIEKWCRVKRIPKRAAYPIARSIWKFGIKPTPIISDFIDRSKVLDDVTKKVEQVYSEELEANMFNLMQEIREQYRNKNNNN